MSTTIRGISKDTLRRQIGQGYRRLRSALEALPPDRFGETLSTGWSLNENLAHLAAFHFDENIGKTHAKLLGGQRALGLRTLPLPMPAVATPLYK